MHRSGEGLDVDMAWGTQRTQEADPAQHGQPRVRWGALTDVLSICWGSASAGDRGFWERCRLFWNQTWTWRGVTLRSVASVLRVSTLGNLSCRKICSRVCRACLGMFHRVVFPLRLRDGSPGGASDSELTSRWSWSSAAGAVSSISALREPAERLADQGRALVKEFWVRFADRHAGTFVRTSQKMFVIKQKKREGCERSRGKLAFL